MKILIVHNRYRQFGGEDTVVEQERIAYKRLGHEVRLFQETNENLSLFDLFFSVFNIKSALKFRKTMSSYKPDAIHVHNFIFKITPSILWFIGNKPKVYLTIHNYRFLCPSGTLFYDGKINIDSKTFLGFLRNIRKGVYQNSMLKTFFLGMVYRINYWLGTFNRIDKFVFLTPFSQSVHVDWRRKLFSNSIIKPNFLNSPHDPKQSTRPIDLIFVGRLSEEKGIDSIIGILKTHESLNIHLVGDGPYLNEINELCSSSDQITIHGKLNRKEALDLIMMSKYLIFPSIWFEGMPMTIIEAFSMGTPVIVKNLGAMASMVVDNKTGYLYEDIENLDKILSSIKEGPKWVSLSSNCRKEFWEKYSGDIGMKNLQNMLDNL